MVSTGDDSLGWGQTVGLVGQEPVEQLRKERSGNGLSRPATKSIWKASWTSGNSQMSSARAIQRFWLTGVERLGPDLLDHLLDTAAQVDARIAALVVQLRLPQAALTPIQSLDWLTTDVPGWLQGVIRPGLRSRTLSSGCLTRRTKR